MDQFSIRPLELNDYDSNYFELLSQLTACPKPEYESFQKFVNSLTADHHLIVLVDINHNKVVGCGTVLLENKVIHNMGKVGHIEDIVTDSTFRGQGLGKLIINYLCDYAHKEGAYKVILDCADYNVGFYSKCDLEVKGVQMAKYFHH